MAVHNLFDHVASLVAEIGAEKQAAALEKKADKNMGSTTHPSDKPDDREQEPSEGAQTADNDRIVRETIPGSTTATPDATPTNVPSIDDVVVGNLNAAPTGEDPSNETVTKGKPEGDKKEGDQGGTTHPAKGEYGEKYSSDQIARMSTTELFKAAADIGNEITADIANGFLTPAKPAAAAPAAERGVKVAAQAGAVGDKLDELASNIVQEVVKSAYHQADLVSEHLVRELALLKQAEGEEGDPTSGASEGEDHGSEEVEPDGDADDAGAGGAPGGDPAADQLLAAMGGGAGGPPPGPEAGMGGGEMPPDAGAGVPPEMGAMDDQQALQQLAMALMEAGIDPQALAAAVPQQGAKIASAVTNYKRSGCFEFTEAKKGSAERKVRDFWKGYVTELYNRTHR